MILFLFKVAVVMILLSVAASFIAYAIVKRKLGSDAVDTSTKLAIARFIMRRKKS